MLRITIPDREYFDEASSEFITVRGATIDLEHSLVSMSKWEAFHKKPFLSKDAKTRAETIDYIRCMTLTENVEPHVYYGLTAPLFRQIDEYIRDPMTATWFTDRRNHPPSREVVTSELIYYWMIALEIPFEPCQNWHLNRLLTLIRVCNVKNSKPQKLNGRELAKHNSALNAARRARLHTKG